MAFRRDKKEDEDGNCCLTIVANAGEIPIEWPKRGIVQPNVFLIYCLLYTHIEFLWISGGNPFQNLDKTAILQEARTFNDTPVNPRKCTHILTKILYLINQVGLMD